jgi:uncharacterized repeat protein (TIGR01451 family)
MILFEAALVAGVLITGLSVSQVAYASPLSAALLAVANPQADVKIDSSIMVERTEISESGETVTTLLDPASVKVIPGDKLMFTNSYRNIGRNAVTGFVVNNPVHSAVTFVEAMEDWALVSVDGGQNFGKLSELSVAESADTRPAVASDVTHVRWILPKPIAPGASGKLRFRGIVK